MASSRSAVVIDDDGVLAAKFSAMTFLICFWPGMDHGGLVDDAVADFHGAGEGDQRHVGMFDKVVAHDRAPCPAHS